LIKILGEEGDAGQDKDGDKNPEKNDHISWCVIRQN